MRKNKLFAVALTVVTTISMLAGCGSSSTGTTSTSSSTASTTEAASTAATAEASSGASATADSDVLRVGMECNYAPFNWTTTTTNEFTQPISGTDYADGYDVVMATKLADAIGKKVQIVKLDWDNLILSLKNNQIDAIIAGMTDTPEREKEVAFTSPYYESEEVMIVKKDGKYASATSIQDFSGATVQGQMNTVYDEVIDQIKGVTHQPAAETFPAAIQALQAGAVDGVVSELPVADGVVAANSDLSIVRFAEGQGFEADTTVSVAVRKEDTDLKDKLEKALADISTDERNQLMEDAVNRQPATE
ncbi:MAG: transporter substrate-binding domain-containing protein [Lachnospiraceae bacterium]|nr:transporter substrate-binding domain-containing protein [Lachnospiraceae bacterium]